MGRAVIGDAAAEVQDDINLPPLRDVVFIMLIFFLVVASFLTETGLDINRSDTFDVPPNDAENILFTVEEIGGMWMDRGLINPRAVRANIDRLHAENPIAVVIIQAHKRSANEIFVQAMDASRQGDIYNIFLAAEVERS